MWIPENTVESGNWDYKIFLNRNLNHQRIFYRKSLFSVYGMYNTKYRIAADHELNIRFFCNSDIVKKYVPVRVSNYYSGGFSSKKTDEVFWEQWDEIIYNNFKFHLPRKTIFLSLGFYCRFLIEKRRYGKALRVIKKVVTETGSLGFIKLMLTFFLKKRLKNKS